MLCFLLVLCFLLLCALICGFLLARCFKHYCVVLCARWWCLACGLRALVAVFVCEMISWLWCGFKQIPKHYSSKSTIDRRLGPTTTLGATPGLRPSTPVARRVSRRWRAGAAKLDSTQVAGDRDVQS